MARTTGPKRTRGSSSSRRGGDAREPWRSRLTRLRAALRERGRDGALITSSKDVRYLTGFHGEDSYLLVTLKEAVLVSDFRFEEDVDAARAVASVHFRRGTIAKASSDMVLEHGLSSLSLQSEHATLSLRDALAKSVGAKRLHHDAGVLTAVTGTTASEERI